MIARIITLLERFEPYYCSAPIVDLVCGTKLRRSRSDKNVFYCPVCDMRWKKSSWRAKRGKHKAPPLQNL